MIIIIPNKTAGTIPYINPSEVFLNGSDYWTGESALAPPITNGHLLWGLPTVSAILIQLHGVHHSNPSLPSCSPFTRPGNVLHFANLKMAIDFVSFPIKNGDVP